MIASANQAAVIRGESPDGVDINTESMRRSRAGSLTKVATAIVTLRHFQIDQETLKSFIGFQVTREMADKAERSNAQHLAVYIDFVDQALLIGSTLEVSAIALLTPKSVDGHDLATPSAFAVVSPPGKFSRRILTWVWGASNEVIATDAQPVGLNWRPNLADRDVLYCTDEEGLFKHRLSFEIDGQSFPGRGLIVGSRRGEYAPAAVECSVGEVVRRIKFSEPDPSGHQSCFCHSGLMLEGC